MKSLFRQIAGLGLTLACCAVLAQSASFPSRPITLVAATTPGGALDIAARMIQPELEKILKQTVIVENRPGAGAQVAAAYVAKSPPDGYTLLVSTGVALVPVFSKTPLVALKNLTPISLLAEGPLLMVVPKELPVKNMPEMFDYIRARPNKLNHATVGQGSAISLYFAWWKVKEKLDMQTIAYPGPGPISTALLRGDVQMALFGTGVAKAYIDTGKGKVIAVTGQKRLKEFPDVQTFDESGVPDIGGTMVAIHAAAGTPAAVVNQVHAALVQLSKAPEFVKRMEALNFVITMSTPEELRQREEADAKWSLEVARRTNLQPE